MPMCVTILVLVSLPFQKCCLAWWWVGPKAAVEAAMAPLAARGVFVKAVDTYGVPYHSPALQPLLPKLRKVRCVGMHCTSGV